MRTRQSSLVAICSPPAEHARQILAAVAAGKPAIFCEKPLATSREEADEVISACRLAGTVLLVGTNHLFDAAWGRARHHLVALAGRVQAISVTLALPPNDRYHRLVAEGGPFQAARRGRLDLDSPAVAAGVLRQLLTGLAIHDLPAVRDIAPGIDEVVYARVAPPIGYLVGYRAGGILVQLALTMLPARAGCPLADEYRHLPRPHRGEFPARLCPCRKRCHPSAKHGRAVDGVQAGSGRRYMARVAPACLTP